MSLRHVPLSALTIRGERSYRAVGHYPALKRMLLADGFRFRVPDSGSAHAHHDRVLFLNLTWWNAGDPSDVLVDDTIDADVIAHAAWHHAARKALATTGAPTAVALLLGESIASAFDLYAAGRLLRAAKRTDYLDAQVTALSAAALDAGLEPDALGALLADVASDPERAFVDLQGLLFDVSRALYACPDVDAATTALDAYAGHRFACFLHHFELATWVLFARAYAGPAVADDPALALDRALRAAPDGLEWLAARWLGSAEA